MSAWIMAPSEPQPEHWSRNREWVENDHVVRVELGADLREHRGAWRWHWAAHVSIVPTPDTLPVLRAHVGGFATSGEEARRRADEAVAPLTALLESEAAK